MNVSLFLEELTKEIQPLTTASNLAYWELNTHCSDAAADAYAKYKKQLLRIYSDPQRFQQLKEFRSTTAAMGLLEARQIELLYHSFLMYQVPQEINEAIIDLENIIEADFVNFRAQLGQTTVADNDLNEIMAKTNDPAKARQSWEASKQIGTVVAPKIIELVKLRNKAAKSLGFPDFWHLSLFANELDPRYIQDLFGQLFTLTVEPFHQLKDHLDQHLALKFKISPDQLQPWHYGDPFFQEIPHFDDDAICESWFTSDLVKAVTAYYQEIGLEPTPILARSDLFERPGKSQHAFCTHIDQNKDIRVLCNMRPTRYWTNTLLHELGHGVYDLGNDSGLPYLLRTPAHILTTEAIAMMMGRLVNDPAWLKEYLRVPELELAKMRDKLFRDSIAEQLIFIRWGLVMVNFESHLYHDPDQDLNTLWWDLVEKYQQVTRPANRNLPDWAAKIHIGTAPVYYQNYILGELTASQLSSYIKSNITKGQPMIKNKAIGDYLTKYVFKPGASFTWDQLIKTATGMNLSSDSFAAEVKED